MPIGEKDDVFSLSFEESSDELKCLDSRRMIGFRGKFLGKLHVSYNCKIKQKQLYIKKN